MEISSGSSLDWSILTSSDATAQEELHDEPRVLLSCKVNNVKCDLLSIWKYGNLSTMKRGKRPYPLKDKPRRKSHFPNKRRRDVYGEPCRKRYRADVTMTADVKTFKITSGKGYHKRELSATLVRDSKGCGKLELRVANWKDIPPFESTPKTLAMFTEQMKNERLTSVCSYHDIKTKNEYFHCIWQIENPSKSRFFIKDHRRSRALSQDDVPSDLTIAGPIFSEANGTSWQAIAYPYGYRTSGREETQLVAMAVRYHNGPESQINAGFQITLLHPDKLNYVGLQETIKDHIEKLKEGSRRSNVFKRGKKGWVLRKFSNRAQIREYRKTSLIFVFSFCVYGKQQMHYRHRFGNEFNNAQEEIAKHMKKLWNKGSPTGTVRMEAKNGKMFRVHPVALQLNGGALACLATRYSPEARHALEFPDMTEAVLRKVIEYCYTLSVTRLERTPFEVLLAAHRYNIKGLQILAEREIVKHINLESILDLYIWNEALASTFLAPFISMFLSTNYGNIRQMPEFDEKLTRDQQRQLNERFGGAHWEDQGFCDSGDESEDGQDYIESELDSDEELMFDDDENEDSMSNDNSDDGNPMLQGEEPEEPQPAVAVNAVAGEAAAAAADQAIIIANMLGDFDMDPDALEFFLLLM